MDSTQFNSILGLLEMSECVSIALWVLARRVAAIGW
jgi:hypothetical protein